MKRILAVFALCLAGLGGPLAAQEPVSPPSAPAAPAHPYRVQAISPHPHGTAVAVALRLHAGSQDDQDGFEGTAVLLGAVLQDELDAALDPAQALARVSVGRATTVITLLALPEIWENAWATVDSVLFVAPLDGSRLEAHKRDLLAQMVFEEGSPYRDFEAEAVGMLAEPGSPFARPLRGSPLSLPNVSPLSLELYRNSFFRRDAAAQAVVGPVADPPVAPTGTVDAPPAGDIAWLTGDRVSLVQDVTSAWISVAYPAPTDLPRTHLELVAHLMKEDLDPTPPPPDRYSLDVRIDETPRGPVLVVEASVFPEAAAAWEARILAWVREMASQPMGEDFFRWRRRRFRAARLLSESAPEAEARRMTADLLRDGTVRDLTVEIWDLDARALQSAVQALGEPRIFLLGPDLGQDGTGSR